MERITHIRRRLAQNLPAGFALLMIFYFSAHALTGDGSIRVLRELKQVRADLSHEAAKLRAQRISLEKRASLLSSQQVDPDLLDEIARQKLGLALGDEVVIALR